MMDRSGGFLTVNRIQFKFELIKEQELAVFFAALSTLFGSSFVGAYSNNLRKLGI